MKNDMTERDDIDRLLHDKLSGAETDLPQGAWARIEQSLADLRREGAFSASETTPLRRADDGQMERVTRRRVWMRSLSAAAALALIVWGGYEYMRRVEPDTDDVRLAERIVTQGPEQTDAVAENFSSARETEPGQSAGKSASRVDTRTDTGHLDTRVLAAATPSSTASSSAAVQMNRVEMASSVETPGATSLGQPGSLLESGAGAKRVQSREKQPEAASRKAGQPLPGNGESTPADRDVAARSAERVRTAEQQDIRPQWVKALETENHRARRRSGVPVSTALYAANFGSGSQSKDVTGVARFSASDLIVTEVSGGFGATDVMLYSENSTRKLDHKMPVTVGVTVSVGIAPRLSVESGVNYTYLASSAEADGAWNYSVEQQLHYVGIPLNLRYNFVDRGRFNLYVSGGGMLEKCVSGTRTLKVSDSDASGKDTERLHVKGWQPSVGAALGGELRLGRLFGLYVEPGVGYYFERSNQPENYRTEHPCSFSLKAGLRVNLN